MAIIDESPAQFEFATFNSLKIDAHRPASSKAPFLFIVKTPASDTLSRSTTRSAAASINSHAQRWAQEVAFIQSSNGPAVRRETDDLAFEKCMMRCRVSRLLEDSNKPLKARRSGAGRKASRIGERRSRRSTPQLLEQAGMTNEKDSSTIPEAMAARSPFVEETPLKERLQTSSTPAPDLSGYSALDPFDSAPLSKNSDVQPVLQYYLSFALLSTPKGDDGQRPPDGAVTRHFSSINAIIQGCMHKNVHMYALLAATTSRMRRVSGVSFRADNGPEIYLHKALQCLRILLGTKNQSAVEDRQIVLDIYYLSVCGWYQANYAESKTHFNVLKYFWKTLTPGQSILDQYIYDLLSYNTIFLEADVTKASSLPTSDSLCDVARNETICSPFAWTAQQERHCSALNLVLEQAAYSPDLRDAVQDLSHLLLLFSSITDRFGLGSRETDWVRSKSKSLVLRLLELPSYGGELCCRLTLVILLRYIYKATLSQTQSKTESEVSVDPILVIQRLKRQLQYEILLPSNEISPAMLVSESANSSNYSDLTQIWTGKSNLLLLWILITGMLGARLTKQKVEYRWFWARAKPLLRLLGISTLGQAGKVLRSFVLVEEMLADQAIQGVLVEAWPGEE